jgi:FHS family L-fucose permease-like MFS transporter
MSAAAESSGRSTVAIIGLMFFVFGFVTWLNGPLISFVQLAFTLTDVEAFLVPSVFYMSYFLLALPAAAILRRTGMKRGMVFGLCLMAVGAVVFGQFISLRIFPGALAGLFVIGAGLALLQTAANPYISIVGPIESAAQRIAVMGICNKAAGILAPIVFGTLVMRGVGDLGQRIAQADPARRELLLHAFAQKVYWPYLGMAGLLLLLAFGVWRSPLPELAGSTTSPGGSTTEALASKSQEARGLLSFPHLWFGVLCLFLYVGVEVMAGDAIGTYGRGFGLPVEQTTYLTSLTLAGMLTGYLVGMVVIPRFVSQERYLAFSAVLGVIMVSGAYATTGYTSVGFVAALGFANAMIWPAIFPLAIRGLGRHTETGSAILVMAISGGAVVPQLFAILKQHHDFQLIFLALMVPSYLYILFFGLYGSKARVA